MQGEEELGEGRGKDMNQTDEPGLSLAVIDPFAPGMIQISFGHFCLLLFDTHPQRALKRLVRSLTHLAWSLMGWDAIGLNKSISICHVIPLIRPLLAWSGCEVKRCITGLIKDSVFVLIICFVLFGLSVCVGDLVEGGVYVVLFQNFGVFNSAFNQLYYCQEKWKVAYIIIGFQGKARHECAYTVCACVC